MSGDLSVRNSQANSVLTYRFGGREYPIKTVSGCKVCRSPYRFDIEEQLVAGRTYSTILEYLPDDTDLNVRNIGDHYRNNHMPLDVSATRGIVEARARKVGKRIEEGIDSLVDGVSLMQVVVAKTFEAIARNEVQPEIQDGLRAAKMLADLGEYDEGGADQQAYVEAFMVYMEQAQHVMDEEQFREFGALLDSNPVLRALAARYEGKPVETVEGEVMEEEAELSGTLDSA